MRADLRQKPRNREFQPDYTSPIAKETAPARGGSCAEAISFLQPALGRYEILENYSMVRLAAPVQF